MSSQPVLHPALPQTSLRRAPSRLAATLASLLILASSASFAPPAHAGAATYTYDALGRLIKVAYANGTVITYTWDAAGNRIQTVTRGVR